MTTRSPRQEKARNRQRREHRKSRGGCGNCKLRRVKCDESRPGCKRCLTYGVSCDYDSQSSDLQPSVNGAFTFQAPQKLPVSLDQTILGVVNGPSSSKSSDLDTIYRLDLLDLDLLKKFYSRTIVTLGTTRTAPLYQEQTLRLASSHPFLLHTVLSLALKHDRFLSPSPVSARQSAAEAFHGCQGSALLNSKLSGPIHPAERDALWATAALLGSLAFASIDATTPEEAWPLKPASPLDLDWLKMGEGKKAIWKLADPMRPDSVFCRAVSNDFLQSIRPSTTLAGPELEARLPAGFPALFGLDDAGSTPANNAYHAAASILAQLLAEECTHATIPRFLCFSWDMDPGFRRLLEARDPRALLLHACWFAKLAQYRQWWTRPRALLEGEAICIYLEAYHGHEPDLRNLLHFPRRILGASGP